MVENDKNNQRETLGFINAAVTLCNNMPSIDNLNIRLPNFPLNFLLRIANEIGCSDKLMNFIVKILTYSLPAIELSIKGLLLNNMNKLIICNLDPRIPNWAREEGFIFDINELDMTNMLSVSPFTDEGRGLYYGISNTSSIYELVRAEDMNAFIWLVKNRGSFNSNVPKPSWVESVPKYYTTQGSKENLALGSTYDSDFSDYMILFKKDYNESDKTYAYHVVPFAPKEQGGNATIRCINWYVNRKTYFNFIRRKKKRNARDYNKDVPLLNMESIRSSNVNRDKIRVRVCPKPYVHLPKKGEPAWRWQRLLFNEKGEPDKKGQYTVNHDVDVDPKTGKYGNVSPNELIGCYKGLTLYQFNYDFVMGMSLFDPQVIASQLLDIALNFSVNLGINSLKIGKTEILGRERIAKIVEKIIDGDNFEVNDCFFNFSNDEFERMMNKSDEKKKNGYFFAGDEESILTKNKKASDILSEYSPDATLEENEKVFTRAFTQVTADITDEIFPEDHYDFQIDFIKTMVTSLVSSLVSVIITPKIILLFEINRRFFVDEKIVWKIDYHQFLSMIMNLIVSIIREIVETILRSLLEFLIKELMPLIACIKSRILQEQVEQYKRLIEVLIKTCSFNFKSENLPSRLDEISHADIVENNDNEDKPLDDKCK